MELSSCNYNCKVILAAALVLASLCLHGPTSCSATPRTMSPGAVRVLPPVVRGEAKLLGHGAVQGSETAGSGASPSPSFTSPATAPPPSSSGGVGSRRSGDDDGHRTPAFESAASLMKTARRLLGVKTEGSSGPSCTSNFVSCPPGRHG